MKVAIIGCGNIGLKRALAAQHAHQIIACADSNSQAAQRFADRFLECEVFSDWRELLTQSKAEIIVVATPHNLLPEITAAAVQAGKHVLVEKPAAIHPKDLLPTIKLAKQNQVVVHVGFNHRYHPALQKAKQLIDAGSLGDLMFIRGRYGHGGRIGYDKEWRAQPEISGGGELIDQGMHLIDLSRWFLGNFTDVAGKAVTYYWDMQVDDNAFLMLTTADNKTAFLQASCTEWKNLFSLEIYGKQGKLDIAGLGGSYGMEKLTYYKMLPQMGPPETIAWEYPMADNSWQIEFEDFVNCINGNKNSDCGLEDAYQALSVVEKIYQGVKK